MKQRNVKQTKQGSVLLVALVISAVGTLGVLATVSIIHARSNVAEVELEGVDRRVKHRNSRELGKEVIFRKYLHDNQTADAETPYTLPDGWGKAAVGVLDEAPFIYSDGLRIHPTGAAPFRAFSKDIVVKLSDGGYDHTTQYHLRSYSPILGGDLLSFHPTGQATAEKAAVIGDLRVDGRAVFWGADYTTNTLGVRAKEMSVPLSNAPKVTFEAPDNSSINPANYPLITQTIGKLSSGNYYEGRLDIVNSAASDANSYFQRLDRIGEPVSGNGATGSCDGQGPDTIPPKPNDADLIEKINDISLTEIELIGELALNSPLSSAVILELLNRATPISQAYLIPLLNAQVPLADDVMIALGNHLSEINQDTRDILLLATGYSYICDGSGGAVVNLQSVFLPNLKLENVSVLRVIGQKNTAEADISKLLDPRVVAIDNPDNVLLEKVILDGITNQRRMVLAVSQTGVLDGNDLMKANGMPSTTGNHHTQIYFDSDTPFVDWRAVVETEGVSTLWNVNDVSSASLIGGIRTDHSIRVEGGTLTLEKETNTDHLESLVSRNGWVEVYE